MKISNFTVSNTKRKSSPIKKQGTHNLMSVKIGLCMAICLAVVLLNIFSAPFGQVFSPENKFFSDKTDYEGELGKLRFVELPGILEVFAGGNDLTVPIEYAEARIDSTSTVLTLKGKSGDMVTTCDDGIVKAIGIDEHLGNYVVINHAGDIETTYYGLETIAVEYSQPIKKLDTLGLLSASGILSVAVKEGGIPKNPCEFFSIPASLLITDKNEA